MLVYLVSQIYNFAKLYHVDCLGVTFVIFPEGGHDSTEDALAALDLMKNRIKQMDNVRL